MYFGAGIRTTDLVRRSPLVAGPDPSRHFHAGPAQSVTPTLRLQGPRHHESHSTSLSHFYTEPCWAESMRLKPRDARSFDASRKDVVRQVPLLSQYLSWCHHLRLVLHAWKANAAWSMGNASGSWTLCRSRYSKRCQRFGQPRIARISLQVHLASTYPDMQSLIISSYSVASRIQSGPIRLVQADSNTVETPQFLTLLA